MRLILVFLSVLVGLSTAAQVPPNDVCANATKLIFDQNGNSCVYASGYAPTASGENFTLNAGCSNQLQNGDYWYEFTAAGPALSVTLEPLGGNAISDGIVYLLSGTCDNYTLIKCAKTPGRNTVYLDATITVGNKYILVVASTQNKVGDFEMCVISNTATDDPGDRCELASRICNKSTIEIPSLANYQASGMNPNCFSFQARKDVWITFTVTKSGTLEFIIDPVDLSEYDWALFDVTNGCPDPNNADAVACNYNYANDEGHPTGMNTNSGAYPSPGEITNPITVTQGKTYALLIDNFTKNNGGFSLEWGGTFEIISSSFELSNVTGCDSVEVAFNHPELPNHTYTWDFGDQTTFIGPNPPEKTYREEGSFLISLEVLDNQSGCNAVSSQIVTVSNPKLETNFIDTIVCEEDRLYMSASVQITQTQSPISYTNQQDITIPDNSISGTSSSILVNFPNNPIIEAGDIKKVCVNISHINVGDLWLELESPSGSSVTLVKSKGGTEDNFYNTCFTNGSTASIASGNSPFSGTFGPENSFDNLVGGTMNGAWKLNVKDLQQNNTGLLDDWTLYLENSNEGNLIWSPTALFADSSKTVQIIDIPKVNSDSTLNISVNLKDNLGCEKNQNLTVTINNNSFAGVGNSADVCNSGTINLNNIFVQSPDPGGTWNGEQTNAGLNTVSGTLNLDGYTPGTYNFTYRLPSKAPCDPAESTITIHVKAGQNAGQDSIFSLCASDSKLSLFNYLGSDVDPGGTWTDVNNSGSFNPSTAELNTSNLNGNYLFTYAHDAFLNCAGKSATLDITIIQAPEIFLDSLRCNFNNDGYEVFAHLEKGDPTSYAVNPNNGTLSGNIFVSNFIPVGNTYSFSVSDKNDCPPLIAQQANITGSYSCNCISEAGGFETTGGNICENDSAFVKHNKQQQLDGNDALMYVLHDSPNATIGTVYATYSYFSEFYVNHQSSFPTGTPLYLSVVAGDATTSGDVDLTDPSGCLDVEPGLQFIFLPKPIISVVELGPDPVCENSQIPINLELLVGEAPFDVSINGTSFQVPSARNFITTVANTLPQTVYTITNVIDNNGCKIDTTIQRSIDVNPRVKAKIIDIQCDANNDNFQVDVQISGDLTKTIESRGTSNFVQVNDTVFRSDWMNSGTNFQAIFNYDAGNCEDDTIAGIHTCNCGSYAGLLKNISQQDFCEGDFIVIEDSTSAIEEPNDKTKYILVADTTDVSSLVVEQQSTTFDSQSLTPGSFYFIGKATGDSLPNGNINLADTCTHISNWLVVRVLPTPQLNIFKIKDSICFGTAYDVQFGLPFTLLKDLEALATLTHPNGTTTNIAFDIFKGTTGNASGFIPSDSGHYNLTFSSFQYKNAPFCTKPIANSIDFYVQPLPIVELSGDTSVCPGSDINFPLTYTQGVLPFTLTYSDGTNTLFKTISHKKDSINITNAIPGNYTYHLISVTDNSSNQCAGNVSGTADLHVFKTPVLTLNQIQTPICENSSFNLSINIAGDDAPYSFDMDTEDGLFQETFSNISSTATINNVPIAQQQKLIFSNFYSKNGCIGNAADINVSALKRPTLSIPNSIEFCEKDRHFIPTTVTGNAPFNIEFIAGNDTLKYLNVLGDSNLTIPEFNIPKQYDFYKITDANQCASESSNASILVTTNDIPNSNITILNDTGCVATEFMISNTTTNVGLANCRWQMDGTTSNVCDTFKTQLSSTGNRNISLRLTSTKGCVLDTQMVVPVVVYPIPDVKFEVTPAWVSRLDTRVSFINKTQGENNYTWYFSDLDSSNLYNAFFDFPDNDTGSYPITLIAQNDFGCTNALTKIVRVSDQLTVFIPSAFTPNNDHLNEVFMPSLPWEEIEIYQLSIFNRWGELIFKTQTNAIGWDGTYQNKSVPIGVYSYKLKVKAIYEERTHSFIGSFNLIR